jgi:hypothetical protein
MPLDSFRAAPRRNLGGALAQLGDESLHALPVRRELGRIAIDPRLEDRHG